MRSSSASSPALSGVPTHAKEPVQPLLPCPADEQANALRLVDNKTNELADWDFDKLKEELDAITIDMSQFGFDTMLADFKGKNDFDDTKRKQKEEANVEIVEHAVRIINSDKNMYKVLFEQKNLLDGIIDNLIEIDLDLCKKLEVL